MKQTAVEWLVEQIKDYDFADIKDNEYYFIQIPTWILKEKIEQAKEMEKEQIIKAHLMARCYDNENSVTEAEQYYTETYESKTNI
jgi:acid stress-induced BolA-like protein IbaG/YrbA